MKYSVEDIIRRISQYPEMRRRLRADDTEARLCFVFFSKEDLLMQCQSISKKHKNCLFTVLHTLWDNDDELSASTGVRVVGFQSAMTLLDYEIVITSGENFAQGSRKIQLLARFVHMAGRPVFVMDFPKPAALQPRANFFRENKEKIEFIVNHLADEESVDCYLSRLKAVLLGEPGFVRYSNYEQYYHPEVKCEEGEIVVEGGVGDAPLTSLAFSKEAGDKGKVYAFEPVPSLHKKAAEMTADRENIVMEPLGVWDKEETMEISLAGPVSTLRKMPQFKNNPVEICQLTRIDKYCVDHNIEPSLIKMDIEGAEENALHGAEQVIAAHKPKLQTCLYHSLKDFLEIPTMTIEKNLDYKIYIGHHTPFMFECLMYAA